MGMTFPLQVAQSRLRVVQKDDDCCSGKPELQGMIPCLRAIFSEKGVCGLYFGIIPKLVSTATRAAFMFAFYEKPHWLIRRMRRKSIKPIAKQIGRSIKTMR